ncbi:hypothetical protein GND96_20955 [Citrobacter sp. JL976]|uniref:hypothetical protein n=1 Tax=Citrobacter sp. JL976 TaxID=2652397 RepID=UPI00090826F4|nr:hypothetical protein [Citrobacter sp. JL976]MTW57877.1 hypothetical protein [Citrobacter sp. JL976]
MKQDDQKERSRLPKGMASGGPVAMRLTADERAALSELATKECRSISSMARMVFLQGMKTSKAE